MGFFRPLLRLGATATTVYTIMAAKDWIDHRSEALTAGELPVAIKRMVAIESDEYAVYDDYETHDVPVIENGTTINVYVPESLLALTPASDATIERKLDRNAERGRSIEVHTYDDAPEPAL